MSDLDEIRADYEKVFGRKPPKSKKDNENWLVKQIDEEQSLLGKAERLGYKGKFKDADIKKFIRELAKKRHYKIVRSSYHLAVNELLSRRWIIESKINPKNDSAEFVVLYYEGDEKTDFILPDDITAEERKAYPMTLLNGEIKEKLKREMNTRILKHINRADIENGYDFSCDVRLKVNLDMKNNEGEIKHFKPQTKKIKIQLKNGADRERLFKKIEEEWNGVYNKFGYRGNNPLVNISEDVLNPEISMNREDYNEKNSWDYWFIYAIKNYELDIQFTYNENDPTHKPQVMKGPIEYFIDGKRVSSEEWKQDKDEEDDEEPNPKRHNRERKMERINA